MTQLPPSQSIDDDYTFRLLGVLTAAGRETAEGWSEIGLLINFDPNTYELRTFSNVVWRGQHYDYRCTTKRADKHGTRLA